MPQWELKIEGRVQGVGFRYLAKELAYRLGIRGYVQNLPDGCVRIIADADENTISNYCKLLRLGNGFSRVDKIMTEPIDHPREYYDFEIR
ncbi:MAG: acylphosphatase [Candidatus Cloacimonadota bacterium]|nr:acylphosphatase [Candidatus Cloacimonadota bacterium]